MPALCGACLQEMRRALFLLLLALAVVGLAWLACAQRRDAPHAPHAQDERAPEELAPANEPTGATPAAGAGGRGPGEAAREPVEPPAAPGPTPGDGRFAGRLVDAETGEPVPAYVLELSDGAGALVRVASDDAGRFTTEEPLAPGRIRIDLVDLDGQAGPEDHRRAVVRVEHDPAAAPADLRIDVGPTYTLDVALPAGVRVTDLGARLHLDPPELGDESQNPVRARTLLRAPRAAGAFPWARFREPNELTRPAWLVLESADGLLAGGARVPSGPGVHPEPVRVVLEPRCAVSGRFVSAVPSDARRGALALSRAGSEDDEPCWIHTERDGRFRIAGLAPGAYRLDVRDEALRAVPVTFELRAGELDLGELAWEPIPLAGKVRLRLRSELRLPLDVQLVRRFAPPRHPQWHSDRWEPLPGGGFESPFEWDEVYAGEYDVRVHTHDLGHWEVTLGALEPPVEDVLLELPAPRPTLALAVVDAGTGEPVEDWTVVVRGERGWEELDRTEPLRFAVWNEDTAFAVCSPGYRAWVVRPGAADFQSRPGEPLVARLERGWSRLFLARRRSRGTPIEGVEVYLDGAPAGRTDARGELWVHTRAPAAQLLAAHPTLRWSWEESDELDELVTWLVLHP